MQMQAHVEQLERAAARLAEGLARHRSEPADEQLRDGLIQRFEFTYDLATKVLRRALKTISATPEAVDLMSYPDLTRTGWEMDFLKGGWPAWKALRDIRNTTSHLYDESKAIDAVAKIPAFQAEIEHFLDRLRARAWE